MAVNQNKRLWAAAVHPGADGFESQSRQVRLLPAHGAKPGIERRAEMGLIEKRENKSVEELEKDLIDIVARLDAYEDSGLTPNQVMELSEAMNKLERYFEDNITVNQVIDFFTDFYVAQGDDGRVEAAVLLTNEAVERYRRLKERDTAKAPADEDEDFDMYVCPSCDMAIGTIGDKRAHNFCLNCGQRLKWEEGARC